MTTQRQRTGNRLATLPKQQRPSVDKYPARLFPVQHEIQRLEDALNAFNERIVELENEGHRGHAMEVLKANAIDFARQIDELRCVLVESTKKDAPNQKIIHRWTRPVANLICRATSPVSQKGTDMPKTVKLRPWTATDVYKLKGLAKKKVGVQKIARALKRTTRAIENKSYLLGVSLDTRGW
jgi:hypothetical protein